MTTKDAAATSNGTATTAARAAGSPSPPPLAATRQYDGSAGGGRTLAQSSGGDIGSDGMPKLFKIVLTGGPCGGKTTALARLVEFFRTHGGCVVRCGIGRAGLQMRGVGVYISGGTVAWRVRIHTHTQYT